MSEDRKDVPGQTFLFGGTPDRRVGERMAEARSEEKAARQSRIVVPGAPSVQPLGNHDVEVLDVSDWDEVSAVPLPCGVSLLFARKGSSVRLGAASGGSRVPCAPADVDALAGRVDELASRVATVSARVDIEQRTAIKVHDKRAGEIASLEKRLAALVSVVEGLNGIVDHHRDEEDEDLRAQIGDLDLKVRNIAYHLRAYVEGSERMGLVPDGSVAGLSGGERTGERDTVRAEVRAEESDGDE